MHNNVVPPINPVSPSRNKVIIQGADGGGPTHCMVLPSKIDGVDTEGDVHVPTLEYINTLNAAHVGIQEVGTHLTPPSQPWQLFKSLADVPQTLVCIPPPMHPTLVGPDHSPNVRASDIMESDDDLFIAFTQAFQRNQALLASRTALPQGNVIVEVPHITTIEQGGPSNHMQPIHETILVRDTSTPPLQVALPIVPSRVSTRSKFKKAP